MEEVTMDTLIAFVAQPEFWGIVSPLAFIIWRVAVWKSKIENGINNLKDRFSEVMEHIREIKEDIRDIRNARNPRKTPAREDYTESSSPKKLNKRDRELAEKMNAFYIAERYIDTPAKKAKEEDMSPYQIQESCEDFAYDEVRSDLREKNREQYRKLEDIAYNEGIYLPDLMYILSLILRDRVLEALKK